MLEAVVTLSSTRIRLSKESVIFEEWDEEMEVWLQQEEESGADARQFQSELVRALAIVGAK
jgi:hypothetical protein